MLKGVMLMVCCRLIDNPLVVETSSMAVILDVLDGAGRRHRAVFYEQAAKRVQALRAGDPITLLEEHGGEKC